MRKPPRMPKIKTVATKARAKPTPATKRRGSSNIVAHHYSPETGHLTVTFAGDRRYRYEGIDQKTAEGFRDAPSQGRFLHAHIIGKFDHVKL